VAAAGEALTDLELGQLTPADHFQRVEVRIVRHVPVYYYPPKRVISGALPPVD
jgi:hypothetical protein